MAAFATSFLSLPSFATLSFRLHHSPSFPTICFLKGSLNVKTLVFASLDGIGPYEGNPRSKKSMLLKLIQEIAPLDVSVIQNNVPNTTVDAMKRTISEMLGLLPSD